MRQEVLGARIINPVVLEEDEKEPRVMDSGEEIKFSRYTRFKSGEDQLTLEGRRNHGVATLWTRPQSRFLPAVFEVQRNTMSLAWGLEPAEGTEVTFGQEEPMVSVEFLGDPDRDIYANLLDTQKQQNRREIEIAIENINPEYQKTVISAGGVYEGRIYGLGHLPANGRVADKEKIFEGEAMLVIEILTHPDIRFFNLASNLVTRDRNGVVRVIGERDLSVYENNFDESLLQRLAEISLFVGSWGRQQYNWARVGLPVLELEMSVHNYLYGAVNKRDREFEADGWYDAMKKRYGFDWQLLMRGYRGQALEIEKKRFRDVLNRLVPAGVLG